MPARKVSLDNTNEKPSLASLKPDKAKSAAAKKRAVKRIDAASATKVPTKRARTAALKKIAAKKLPTKEKAEEVTLQIAPEPAKAPRKRVAKAKKEDIALKTTVERTKSPATEFAVTLPNNMSIRAREKALVLLHYIQQDFRVPAQRIAYIGGFAFVLFGAGLSLSFAVVSPNSALQSATIASTTDTLNTVTTDTTSTVLRPTFISNDTLPAILTSDFTYTFTVQNGKNVSVRLYSFADGRKISLNIEKVYTDTYRTNIRFGDLARGEYKLELIAESVQDSSKSFFSAGSFVVEKAITETTDTSGSGSSTTSTSGSGETSQTTTNTTSTTDTSGSGSTTGTTDATSANTTSATTTLTETVTESGDIVTEPKLLIDGSTFEKQEVVKVEVPEKTRVVEMYLRPLKSVQSRFLGSAVQGKTYWYYFFDTLQVPNGDYEIYARTRSDTATFLTSDSKKIKVANATVAAPAPTATSEPVKEPDPAPLPVPEETEDIDEESADDEEETVVEPVSIARSFSEIPPEEFTPTASTTVKAVEEEVSTVLSDYREELMELLRRYAVAQQSGDPLLITIARKELEESRIRLITNILSDDDSNHLADDVDEVLAARFESLQKRVETFEQLRRSANDETTGIDTDRDGISDFDEQNLYRTSPEQPDTDSDGVTDGIEIMRGFDPLDSEAEAVINYELPQDTIALVQDETLKIDAVLPVIQTDSLGNGNLPVFAEIRGKALPNSFVTIYVFSAPTIVTVRTDNDGSFVYTFEKELEDGDHEVYVAVTDNTGAIMARSNPFRFVKEAQAFTPVDSTNTDVVSAESLAEFTAMNSYNIAVGIGILAFGIILLMLGISLREKDPVVMTKPEHDLKTA